MEKTKTPTGMRTSARTLGLTDDKMLEGIQLAGGDPLIQPKNRDGQTGASQYGKHDNWS